MAKRKGYPTHGWLILDKPEGLTSTRAVSKIKRLFEAQKVGHAGTLDPLATGILPIALGEATKTVPFVMDGRKAYEFTVRWGAETTTDDSEGEVTKTSETQPSTEQINALLPEFTGKTEQIPPQYSAIKVEGERAYDLARDGEEFTLAPRTITIDNLELLENTNEGEARFYAECGKGTYVRALARDMGRKLKSYGHITALRRTRVGPFSAEQMISLDMLEELRHSARGRDAVLDVLQPVETALDDIPALAINNQDALRLKRGQSVLLRSIDPPISKGPYYAMSHGTLVAVGEVSHGSFKPTRVFNLPQKTRRIRPHEDHIN